jgi:hypothetical protein
VSEVEKVETGLHLHHHLSPRRERAMFAALGFVVTLAITRAITTMLHDRGAGANGGIIVGGVHIHHFVFGMIGLLLLAYATGLLLWACLIAPFAQAVWRRLRGRSLPAPRRERD